MFREQQGCFETHHPRGQWLASRKNFNRHGRIDQERVFRKANQEDRAKGIFEAIEKHRPKISMVHRVVQEADGNVLVVCRVRGGNSWCKWQSGSLSFLLSRVLDTWQEKRLGFRCTRYTYTWWNDCTFLPEISHPHMLIIMDLNRWKYIWIKRKSVKITC